jgi:hypothetical protein
MRGMRNAEEKTGEPLPEGLPFPHLPWLAEANFTQQQRLIVF